MDLEITIFELVRVLDTNAFKWVEDKTPPSCNAAASIRVRKCGIIVKIVMDLTENSEQLDRVVDMLFALHETIVHYSFLSQLDTLVRTRLLGVSRRLLMAFCRFTGEITAAAALSRSEQEQNAGEPRGW